jgi:hypothetical protein
VKEERVAKDWDIQVISLHVESILIHLGDIRGNVTSRC